MANLSGRTGITPVNTRVSLANNAASTVQNFNAYDSQELLGYVYIDATTDARAAVKVTVVKNGAGTYEVAATDIAGDDIGGSPIVSFSMSGSVLQATLPNVSGFVSAYIDYHLVSPVTWYASAPAYEEGTWSPSFSVLSNLQAISGTSITFGEARYTRVGQLVTATIEGITNVEIITNDTIAYGGILPTGLPYVTNDTYYWGTAGVRVDTSPYEALTTVITEYDSGNTLIFLQVLTDSAVAISGDNLGIYGITIQYYVT